MEREWKNSNFWVHLNEALVHVLASSHWCWCHGCQQRDKPPRGPCRPGNKFDACGPSLAEASSYGTRDASSQTSTCCGLRPGRACTCCTVSTCGETTGSGTLKRYFKALKYEYRVKTVTLSTLKWYFILSLTLYLEWYCAYSILYSDGPH
jgi:hypothetical protein